MERLYIRDDSGHQPLTPSSQRATSIAEEMSEVSSIENGAKQKQDKESIPEIPKRTKKDKVCVNVTNSSV